MKKSDLKTGMVVELKNGTKFTVFLGAQIGDFLDNNSATKRLNLDCYNEDLTGKIHHDIVKVYSQKFDENDIFDYSDLELIWLEKEKVKVNMEFNLIGETLSDIDKIINDIESIINKNCTQQLRVTFKLI